MKINKIRQQYIIIGGFFLFIFDRVLKYASQNWWMEPKLFWSYFGWNPFLNKGVAFGILIPNFLTIFLTLIFLIVILYLSVQNKIQHQKKTTLIFILIFLGSLSNFLDRIFFSATLDYWQLATGIFNLADVMIVIGFILFASQNLSKK